ncbi:hypothetical protein M378DRAFT_729807 [Amanita muscaria Koide BX008]|uniref:Uncharacterized protein n=1 Tax=Amanita muscaria (strain Koide BX008) TaxID=946122 RepID=A0A0C2X377_AMAMK|nr:hypothetical protein M378DRAFT_729807 [Amanita muscaria Koide BX008]
MLKVEIGGASLLGSADLSFVRLSATHISVGLYTHIHYEYNNVDHRNCRVAYNMLGVRRRVHVHHRYLSAAYMHFSVLLLLLGQRSHNRRIPD